MTSLKELKVLEFAGVLAGPSVGMFFAELGARVIKVEAPNGDVTRSWKLSSENPESSVSAYFSSINYGKEYQRIDLKTADGQKALQGLIKDSDVIITNNPTEQGKKLGLDRATIAALNPRIIHGHIKGFAGSDRPAYDVVLQAETGYISMTGSGEQLAKLPIAMIDVLAGHQLKEGLLVALLEHRNKGAYVEVSLEKAALSGLINQASNYLMTNKIAEPMGTQHPNIAPYGDLFTSGDGKLLLFACGSDSHFQKLCTVLGVEDLVREPRFQCNQDRLRDRAALCVELQKAVITLKAADVLAALEEQKVPAAEVKTIDAVLNSEPAQSMILKETIDGVASLRIRGNAFEINPE